jgi:Ca-activated chloride channel family protein
MSLEKDRDNSRQRDATRSAQHDHDVKSKAESERVDGLKRESQARARREEAKKGRSVGSMPHPDFEKIKREKDGRELNQVVQHEKEQEREKDQQPERDNGKDQDQSGRGNEQGSPSPVKVALYQKLLQSKHRGTDKDLTATKEERQAFQQKQQSRTNQPGQERQVSRPMDRSLDR